MATAVEPVRPRSSYSPANAGLEQQDRALEICHIALAASREALVRAQKWSSQRDQSAEFRRNSR